MIEWAEKGIYLFQKDKRGEPPYSTDANLLHISYEGKALEDPWVSATEEMFTRTVSPNKAPDEEEEVIIEFKEGTPVSVNGKQLSPADLLEDLNAKAGKHGVGRVDIVENRLLA